MHQSWIRKVKLPPFGALSISPIHIIHPVYGSTRQCSVFTHWNWLYECQPFTGIHASLQNLFSRQSQKLRASKSASLCISLIKGSSVGAYYVYFWKLCRHSAGAKLISTISGSEQGYRAKASVGSLQKTFNQTWKLFLNSPPSILQYCISWISRMNKNWMCVSSVGFYVTTHFRLMTNDFPIARAQTKTVKCIPFFHISGAAWQVLAMLGQ